MNIDNRIIDVFAPKDIQVPNIMKNKDSLGRIFCVMEEVRNGLIEDQIRKERHLYNIL